jgi:hypothetical protein
MSSGSESVDVAVAECDNKAITSNLGLIGVLLCSLCKEDCCMTLTRFVSKIEVVEVGEIGG